MPQPDHYQVLGVPRSATPEEIKRAWARKIREFPPDRAPVENQQVNEAKRALLEGVSVPQPSSEAKPVADPITGAEAALEAADEARRAGNDRAEANHLKEALAFDPGRHEVRSRYAGALARLGDISSAIRVMEGLVRRQPGSASDQFLLGRMLCQANDADANARALACAETAVRLAPGTAPYLCLLSIVYHRAGRALDATNALARAVTAAGADIASISTLADLHLLLGRFDQVEPDAGRMRQALARCGPARWDQCARFWADHAVALSARDMDAAAACARVVSWFTNPKPQVAPAIQTEMDAVRADRSLLPCVTGMLLCRAQRALGLVTTEAEATERKRRRREARQMHAPTVLRALEQAVARYPVLYRLDSAYFDQWIRSLRAGIAESQAAATPPRSAPPAHPGPTAPRPPTVAPARPGPTPVPRPAAPQPPRASGPAPTPQAHTQPAPTSSAAPLIGAVIGGVIGYAGGPVGSIVGALVGSGIGTLLQGCFTVIIFCAILVGTLAWPARAGSQPQARRPIHLSAPAPGRTAAMDRPSIDATQSVQHHTRERTHG